ncbi:protein LNK3-like [Papaver somniferum]|uniref:protein LNK3-like n=1 Tax=Papaver somniferum TaxID=3469 RepID=UPI000E70166F|nr:protein LNK3-like [Papaver somniferum]
MYNMENYNSSKVNQQRQYQDECDRPLTSDDRYQWMQSSSSDGICPVVENGKQNSEMKSKIAIDESQYLGGDWPEYTYDSGQNNKMAWEDEFSISSMLKDDMDVPQMSLGGEHDCSSARLDKMFDDMVADSQSKCTDQSDLGSSKYMKHDYPQSMYWNKLDETSNFMVSNTDQTEATVYTKAPVKSSAEQEEDANEEVSCKAMQDLEDVMTQLTSETRLFFRDALYRLANNSKQQQQAQSQNRCGEDYKPQVPTQHQENSMYGRSDNMELETNIIDRTVAKLMFNEMNCNETDDFCVDSVDFSDASFTAASSFNNCYDQSVQCHNSN